MTFEDFKRDGAARTATSRVTGERLGDCLIVQPIHAAGLDRLERAGLRPRLATATDAVTLAREAAGCIAVVTRNIGFPADAIAAAPHLRVIGVHGAGTDPVALPEASRAGIAVVNTPGANARSVAEHAIALMFALVKALPAADHAVRTGNFGFKYNAGLLELQGRCFGVIGFGQIGRATARLAAGLGMRVIAYGPSRPEADFAAVPAERAETIAAVIERADVVSLHLPLTAQTRGLIGLTELASMKSDAFLINTSRGGLIDEPALIAALEAGRIGGAGLDVFASEDMPADHPLLRQQRAILTPHVAGSTTACLVRTAEAVVEQVIDVLAGQRPASLVNPDVWAHRRLP
ncbi:hydroxyacid dehydrogenase [Bradyrhizobium prioriisuperbiae]|uniref:hydroxyacid dehydrogenase n=1 Tax=Bradyrhizobium prioriisuperbiae TaxID=2854389 RepID=UPI0028E66928|nr:hydroxyacid dehydrogenase [Bradyrhizobium prioritasuperba]